ncbi:MAG: hypothetical protein AVDCRST_MAG64-2135, partial [uncultured Phycisphaerae bacterium]
DRRRDHESRRRRRSARLRLAAGGEAEGRAVPGGRVLRGRAAGGRGSHARPVRADVLGMAAVRGVLRVPRGRRAVPRRAGLRHGLLRRPAPLRRRPPPGVVAPGGPHVRAPGRQRADRDLLRRGRHLPDEPVAGHARERHARPGHRHHDHQPGRDRRRRAPRSGRGPQRPDVGRERRGDHVHRLPGRPPRHRRRRRLRHARHGRQVHRHLHARRPAGRGL